VNLIRIADGKEPLPAEKVCVRTRVSREIAGPKMRRLTGARWEQRRDGIWLRWEWEREGQMDFGYSAIRADCLAGMLGRR